MICIILISMPAWLAACLSICLSLLLSYDFYTHSNMVKRKMINYHKIRLIMCKNQNQNQNQNQKQD